MMCEARRKLTRSAATALALSIGLAAAGCDLLDVDNPQAISPEDLNDPEAAAEIANGAAATFADGYAYAIAMSELAADAVIWVSSQTGLERLDQGIWLPSNPDIDQSYNLLARARWTADNATDQLEEVLAEPGSSVEVAESHLYAGFSLVLLGDHFERFTVDGGEARDDTEAYGMAVDRFTEALQVAEAAGATQVAAAALGGRARARHALAGLTGSSEDYAVAFDDAQSALALDPDFAYSLTFEQPARPNLWWFRMQSERDVGVGAPFRQRIDPVSGAPDPRVPVSDFQGMSSNGQDSVFLQQKYPTGTSGVELVGWKEMKLIEAEVLWRDDDLPGAVDAINAVRSAADLPEFDSDDATEVRDQLIYERSAVFFLEGRRWSDGRRFSDEFGDVEILPDDRWSSEAQLEPVTRKWPIPDTERQSNPNL